MAVGIGYVEAWLRGIGCVPLFNLMEDAATAEISRAQVWQWVRHNQKLDDGRVITKELVREIVRGENDKVKAQMGEENYAKGRWDILRGHGLKAYAVSNHLVGQAICDPIDERHKAILLEDAPSVPARELRGGFGPHERSLSRAAVAVARQHARQSPPDGGSVVRH